MASSVVLAGAASYTTRYTYDIRHRVLSSADPAGHTQFFGYDAVFGNLDSTLAPGQRSSKTQFDGVGRDSVQRVVNQPRRFTLYDAMNRVVQHIADVGPGAPVQDPVTYTYGDGVNLTQVQDPAGNLYRYAYNLLGLPTTVTDPFGAADTTRYDAEARVRTWRSRVTTDSVVAAYDTLGRLRQQDVFRSGVLVRRDSLGFDPAERWVAGVNAVSRDTVYLGATGLTDSVVTRLATDNLRRIVRRYLYDLHGRPDSTHVVYPGSIAATGRKYLWSAGTGALTGVRANGVGPGLSYDAELQPSGGTLPGGITVTSWVTSVHAPVSRNYGAVPLNASFWRSLNYDLAGRVDMKYDWDAPTGNMPQREYFYDARGRLQRMLDSVAQTTGPLCEGLMDLNNGGTPCLPNALKSYGGQDTVVYDRVGNVSAAVTPEANGTTVLNRNRMTGWPQASGSAKMTYTFDAAGQRRTWDKGVDQTTRYWWSPDGLLDSVRVGASTPSLPGVGLVEA